MSSIQKHRKFAVMGCRGVGKTSLINYYVDGSASEEYVPTVESITDKIIKLDGKEYECEIVDTAGQDEFNPLQSAHFNSVHAYIIVFSITSKQTLATASIIIDKILNNLATDHANMILVANKQDRPLKERQVTVEDIQKVADAYKCRWIETSALDGTNVAVGFETLLRDIEKSQNPPEVANGMKCLVM